MSGSRAIDHALDLYRFPSAAPALRQQPLPDDVGDLLRAAVDESAAQSLRAECSPDRGVSVQEAIGFYIEQVLLHPQADAYRALGASATAPREVLRANMALLSHWLHPDRNTDEDRTVYLGRVLAAWEQVKTPERRQAYDIALNGEGAKPERAASVSPQDFAPAAQAGHGARAAQGEAVAADVRSGTSPPGPAMAEGAAPFRNARRPAPGRLRHAGSRTRAGLAPRPRRRGFFAGLLRWTRRTALLGFVIVVVLFLFSPNEMLTITEFYWREAVEAAQTAAAPAMDWMRGF